VAAMEAYDSGNDSWTTLRPMPTARALTSAGSVGEMIVVLGGGSADLGTLDSALVEIYDSTTDRWSAGADLPSPRGALTASVVNGILFAIGGGFEVGNLATVEAYDPGSDSWSGRHSMPTARWGASSNVVGGKIFVLGGSTERGIGHNSLATNEEYTASGFDLNAGLNDAWFYPATDGQGLFIIVYPKIPLLFLAWFTYETDTPDGVVLNRQPGASQDLMALLGDDEHRWLTASGPYEGDSALLNITVTRGGRFDAGDPVEREVVGTIELTFEDCKKGLVKYSIPSINRSGEVPIQRVANDNVELCEDLSGR